MSINSTFKDIYLTIYSNADDKTIATFHPSSNSFSGSGSDSGSGSSAGLPTGNYSQITILASGVAGRGGNFMQNYTQTFFYNREGLPTSSTSRVNNLTINDRLMLSLSFEQPRPKCLNSTEILEEVVARYSQNPDLFIKTYDFSQVTISDPEKLIWIYQANWAILFFTLYLSHENKIGVNFGQFSNFFAPFDLRNLLGLQDDLETICAAVNLNNLNYLQPTAFVAGNISNAQIPVRMMSLMSDSVPVFIEVLDDYLDEEGASGSEPEEKIDFNLRQEGVLVAAQGLNNTAPQLISQVTSQTQNGVRQLQSSVAQIQQIADNSERNIQNLADTGLAKIDKSSKESIDAIAGAGADVMRMIGELKIELTDKFDQQQKQISGEIDQERIEAIKSVQNSGAGQVETIRAATESALQQIGEEIETVQKMCQGMEKKIGTIETSFKKSVEQSCHRIMENFGKLEHEQSCTIQKIDDFCQHKTCQINQHFHDYQSWEHDLDGKIENVNANLSQIIKDAQQKFEQLRQDSTHVTSMVANLHQTFQNKINELTREKQQISVKIAHFSAEIDQEAQKVAAQSRSKINNYMDDYCKKLEAEVKTEIQNTSLEIFHKYKQNLKEYVGSLIAHHKQ